MTRTPRIEFYNRAILFNYRIICGRYMRGDRRIDEYKDIANVGVRLDFMLWDRWNIRYDGITAKGFTLLGISFFSTKYWVVETM